MKISKRGFPKVSAAAVLDWIVLVVGSYPDGQ